MNKKIMLLSNTSWYLFNFRDTTIKKLILDGYEPICVAPEDEYSRQLVELGATFVPLDIEGKSTNVLSELKALYHVFSIIKSQNPDCVLNFTIKLNIYSGLSCLILNVPFINNISGLGTAFIHKGFSFKVAKLLYGIVNRNASWVFFQNDDDRKQFLDNSFCSESNSSILPGSGVDLEKFCYSPKYQDSKEMKFLMISRLISDKGVNEYVSSAKDLKLNNPHLDFTLVGELYPSNKSAIPRNIVESWLDDPNITVMPHSNNINQLICDADVIVLPSYREGLPRTIIEAASVGRPAIVTDVPGCRQAVINNETGWYCDAKSAESLKEKILMVSKLSHEKISEFGKNARLNVEENFSVDIVVSEYMDKIVKHLK
ncbi:glycosyltransferase family 4 protein [Vibrio sp. J1-1]|uniref:glycosyltransferase family 4 protein n=1 Tax=Vibrio sp. J1-1 TaxID=2912251 RepID=UPI001F25C51F|nr:glycosyltransferase family 4 protein [Vibrio sp. J1-1]MCF7482048.1 glycosyltransferase family 4 protein [Vibrio sp. J1-1]